MASNLITSNDKGTPRHHKLFGGSSYDRYLDMLLFMWPSIIEVYPDAELHICYGWDLFDKIAGGNPERQKWKEQVNRLMSQKGIIHHGRLGKKELKKVRKSCGIWAYPTYFHEINCITALECQKDGVVPVTMNLAALAETVYSGILVDGDIKDPNVKDTYIKELLSLMGDKKKWKKEHEKAQKGTIKYRHKEIARQWIEEFSTPITQPLVTVATVTIREGFWDSMAANIKSQSHSNIEWLIVDDHKEDRSKTAQQVSEDYDLPIRYIRGDKVLGKYNRRYGLVRANNKAWQRAKGELIVWLQDFIYMPMGGVEFLVDLYRHNPNALLAPTDDYCHSQKANKDNKRDWWDGNRNFITSHSWKNVRNKNIGIRESENPFEFEMNYGAIPREIIEDLGGWYEFFDNGLGFDNSEFATRALKKGYRLIVDDTNMATAVDLWPIIGGTNENIIERERHLAEPQWLYLNKRLEESTLGLVRDPKIDDAIDIDFSAPKEIPDEQCVSWIKDNAERIAAGWLQ